MTPTRISVILNTVRPDYPMIGRPDTWIFEPTLRSLDRQRFRDFELVIVDALAQRRAVPTWQNWTDRFVRWMPFPPSPWFAAGYYAISAPKNEALRYCNGELVVQIDDCCELDPDYLARCWKAHRRGVCLASLVEHRRGGCVTSTDPRLSTMTANRQIVAVAYGYLSFPLRAALRINGYDEGYDGAKCLEDADFARRLRLSGERLEIDRRHVVIEHEHGDVAPEAFPGPGNVAKGDRSIRCNAVHDWIVMARHGEDRIRANRRPYSPGEWSLYDGGCPRYLGAGRCAASPHPCNWLREPGNPDAGTWWGADPNWPRIREWMPTFDLAAQWQARRKAEGMSEVLP